MDGPLGDPTRIFDNVNTIDDNTIHDEDYGNLKFYNSASNQDNTYRNSNDDYRVKPKNMNFIYYDRGYHKPSDFETAAAALDLTLNSIGDTIGDVGLSFLGKWTKEHKQEAQCAQKEGRLLVFVICTLIFQ